MSDPREPERAPGLIRFEIAPKSIVALILIGVTVSLPGRLAAILVVILCSLSWRHTQSLRRLARSRSPEARVDCDPCIRGARSADGFDRPPFQGCIHHKSR